MSNTGIEGVNEVSKQQPEISGDDGVSASRQIDGLERDVRRARLAQAFGRLIRSKDDAGHFIVLSPAFPSRLLSAFPDGTPVMRLTLEEALQRVAAGVSVNDATVQMPAGEEPA